MLVRKKQECNQIPGLLPLLESYRIIKDPRSVTQPDVLLVM